MSLSRQLVEFVHRRSIAPLPAEIAEKTRLHIADAIGISLAARHAMPMGQSLCEAMSAGGGVGACTVLGGGITLAPASAAFVNSALGHMLDFDDMHDAARMHPTSVTLPAALAAAELTQVKGDTLIKAVAIGNELMCRLGLLLNPRGSGPGSKWFLTQFFGYFGASVAAGIVLRMTADELVASFGLAYMQAAGGKEAGLGIDSNARSIYPAFAAMGGVTSVLLARAGLIGPPSALDGTAGLFDIYHGVHPSADQIAALVSDQGWVSMDLEVKPWPSCRISHPYVATALAVRDRLSDQPIDAIDVAVNASAARMCRPLEARCEPRTIQDAKHSLPFMTAFALVHGRVDMENLDDSALNDRRVVELAKRIQFHETLPDTPGNPPAEITVRSGGRTVRSPAFTDSMLQVSEAQIHQKFNACLAHCGLAGQASDCWNRLADLASADVRGFLQALPTLPDKATEPIGQAA